MFTLFWLRGKTQAASGAPRSQSGGSSIRRGFLSGGAKTGGKERQSSETALVSGSRRGACNLEIVQHPGHKAAADASRQLGHMARIARDLQASASRSSGAGGAPAGGDGAGILPQCLHILAEDPTARDDATAAARLVSESACQCAGPSAGCVSD